MSAKVKGLYRRGRQWWLRYTPRPGAKQKREPLGTDSEEVASVLALQILHGAPLEAAGELQEEIDKYIAEATSQGTLSRTFAPTRRCLLEVFVRDTGIESIGELTTKAIEGWVMALKARTGKEKVKSGTVLSYVYHVQAFCTWLVKKHRLRENPAKKIEFGKAVKTWRKDFAPADRVRHLLAEAPDDDMRFILYCGFHEGMRKLEIVEARPEWFRLGTGTRRGCIVIGETPTFKPKDRDERTIPLTAEFEEFLRRYLKELPDGASFVLRPDKKHRKHRYRYDFRKPFAEFMKAQKMKITAHDMRRSFVSNKLIENGALLPKLAKWTGDDVRTMMDHYAHLLADDDDIDVGL